MFFLAVIVIVILAALIPIDTRTVVLSPKVKTCPPHQWTYQDIVDENKVKTGERMVCKVCGPIKLQVVEDGN